MHTAAVKLLIKATQGTSICVLCGQVTTWFSINDPMNCDRAACRITVDSSLSFVYVVLKFIRCVYYITRYEF